MSTTSTVVAFRAALIAALQAHATITAGDDVQVADGWQGPDTEAEGIYLAGLELESVPLAFKSATRMPRQEEYRQTVEIITHRAPDADNPQGHSKAVERAMALFAALEDVTATDVEPGGVNFGRITSAVLDTNPDGPGWAARLTVVVTVTAALT